MDKQRIKISFLGDITCDRPMLKAAKQIDGTYDFTRSLINLKSALKDSDYVVGNLETVFAGESFGYNPGPITYNTPDALLDAIKEIGVTMLTTANNHCLDCGKYGLERTIDLLDNLGLKHTGTFKSNTDTKERFLVQNIKGIKIAFVSLTDCLNSKADGTFHGLEEWNQVNQLRSYKGNRNDKSLKYIIKKYLPFDLINSFKAQIKRIRGIPLVKPYTDNYDIPEEDLYQIEKMIELLKEAKSKSDIVIACVHCGGQFNAEPGTHAKELYKKLEPYADAIIGNHPHVVQKVRMTNDKIIAYSLGSLNMSLSADYVSKKFHPDISLLLHIYISKEKNQIRISECTGEMLLSSEDDTAYVVVKSVKKEDVEKNSNKEINKKVSDVYNRIVDKELVHFIK